MYSWKQLSNVLMLDTDMYMCGFNAYLYKCAKSQEPFRNISYT